MNCGNVSWSKPKFKKSSINHRSRKMTHQLVCYKLEKKTREKKKLKKNIKSLNLFWNMKQLPCEYFKFLTFYIILVLIRFSIKYFSSINQRDEADAGISNLASPHEVVVQTQKCQGPK